MKTENLIILGALAIGGYLLWKSGALDGLLGGSGGGGGGGGGGNDNNGGNDDDAGNGGGGGGTNYSAIHTAAGSRQGWTGVTYGQPGQPSIKFMQNTLAEAKQPGANARTKMAAAGIYAGAPPRMVAKMKAGKVY